MEFPQTGGHAPQSAGHEVHVSPGSQALLAHLAEQSESRSALHPGAQQPSPGLQVVMVLCAQPALQFVALPVIASIVHASASSQLVGHVATGSQVSRLSSTPLSHVGEQSASLVSSHPAAQHPSAAPHEVIG